MIVLTETPGFGLRARCLRCGWAGPDRGYGPTSDEDATADGEAHACLGPAPKVAP